MKNWKLTLILPLFAFIFTSCDKKDNPDDFEFSELTVEQHKAKVEESGRNVLAEVKSMETDKTFETMNSMMSFVDLSSPTPSSTKGILNPIRSFMKIKDYSKSSVIEQLKSVTEDPQSFSEAWNKYIGTYSWDVVNKKWNYTKTGTSIKFQFPSTKIGTSNNAVLEIYDYTGFTPTTPAYSGYTGDIPSQIKMSLKVDNATLLTYEFKGTYTNEGYPTSVSIKYGLGLHTFEYAVSNTNNSEASFSFYWKKSDKIIIGYNFIYKGDWSKANIDKNKIETSYNDYEWNPETQKYEIVVKTSNSYNYGNILTFASTTFQLDNIKLIGEYDIKTYTKLNEINQGDGLTKEEAESMVKIINEACKVNVRLADNNKVIAVMESYIVEETYPFTNKKDYSVGVRMKFHDNSYNTMKQFYKDSFSDLMDELDSYFDSLGSKYGK